MKLGIRWIAIFILSLFCQLGLQAQKNLDAGIEQLMQQYQAMGLSIAVVNNNQVVYNRSFGYKDPKTKTRIQNTDIFRIASISKSFTATGLMQLVDAGTLALDADMSDLVGFTVRNPAFPNIPITLKMVLSHTSSINDQNGYFSLDAIHPDKNPNWAKAYNSYAPGAGYQYCNLNFNMAGTILEKFSGERFDQYIKHHILDPLHLYGGYLVDSLNKDRLVPLYEYNASTKELVWSSSAYASPKKRLETYQLGYSTPLFSPTGGMKISALDLAKYMMMHMNGGSLQGVKIISPASSQQMQTPLSDKESYGLALLKTQNLIPGKTMVGHTGSAYGLFSTMFFQPDEKFGFVVITNGCREAYKNGYQALLYETVNYLYQHLIQP